MFPVELQSASAAAAFRKALCRIQALDFETKAALAEVANAVNRYSAENASPSQRDAARDHLLILRDKIEDTAEKRLDIAASVARRMDILESQVETLLSTLIGQQTDLKSVPAFFPSSFDDGGAPSERAQLHSRRQENSSDDNKANITGNVKNTENAIIENNTADINNAHSINYDRLDERSAADRNVVYGHNAEQLGHKQPAIKKTSGVAPEGLSLTSKHLTAANDKTSLELEGNRLCRNIEACDVSQASSDKSTSGSTIEIAKEGGSRSMSCGQSPCHEESILSFDRPQESGCEGVDTGTSRAPVNPASFRTDVHPSSSLAEVNQSSFRTKLHPSSGDRRIRGIQSGRARHTSMPDGTRKHRDIHVDSQLSQNRLKSGHNDEAPAMLEQTVKVPRRCRTRTTLVDFEENHASEIPLRLSVSGRYGGQIDRARIRAKSREDSQCKITRQPNSELKYTRGVRHGGGIQNKLTEPLYCYCQQPYRQDGDRMIACDGRDCPVEWFHYDCVHIVFPPRGSWFCSECDALRVLQKRRRLS